MIRVLSAVVVGVLLAGAAGFVVIAAPSAAQAVAGNPGVPSAPTTIYSEGFENVTSNPQMVTTYSNAALAGSYIGSTYWTSAAYCNGIVLSGSAAGSSYTDPASPSTGTCTQFSSTQLKALPPLLGQLNGVGNSNHALSGYTAGNGTSNEIQIETPSIPVTQYRWYTASVNFVAQNCSKGSPIYNFYLVDPATSIESLIGGPINACSAGSTIGNAKGGTIQSNGSMQWTGGSSLRLRLRNGNANGNGNDTAIDDLKLVDATPQLDKQFVPATGAKVGTATTLRFTITNTSELAAKTGIPFTDTLPTGLTVASAGVTSNTCGGTVTAVTGSGGISLANGQLAQNTTSCVIEVSVVASSVGVYSNGSGNVQSPLLPPATATLTVSDPHATADAVSTPHNTATQIAVLSNDSSGDSAHPLASSSVIFPTTGQPTGATVSSDGKTLTVPGQGVYAASSTGVVTFTPESTFSGTATPVTYAVSDTDGAQATSTVTVSVGSPPTATADTAVTGFDRPVTVSVLANDHANGTDVVNGGSNSLVAGSVTFPAAGQPTGASVSIGGTVLTVPGEGTYTALSDGTVRFEPVSGFSGVATPVVYRVAQSDSTTDTATATLRITVTAAPVAPDDASFGPYDRAQDDIAILANDTAASGTSLVPSSVVFPSTGQPSGATVQDAGKTLVLVGVGTFTVNSDGTVDFVPVPGYTGTAAPVLYQVSDSNGGSATGHLAVSVGAAPVADDDVATTTYGTTVTIPILSNDSADPATSLDPSSVVLTAGPPGASITNGGRTLTAPGQGVFTVDPTTGAVDFAPASGFTGTVSDVIYRVADQNGNTASATVSVTVTPPPTALNDAASTVAGQSVTVAVLSNDSPGTSAALDPSSVMFPTAGQPAGATRSSDGKTLAVPGEGVYTVGSDGRITFAPAAGFTGTTTPVTYRVADGNGTTATARLTVQVGTGLQASDDLVSTAAGTAVDVEVLANDHAAADGSAIDASATVFAVLGQPVGSVVSADGTSISVPGEGVYTLDGTGVVHFVPDAAFSGTTTPVIYRISDAAGRTATATVSVVVGAAVLPAATADAVTTGSGESVRIYPLRNDRAGQGRSFVASSLVLTLAGLPAAATLTADQKTLTIPGVGVYTVASDGSVLFDPADGFSGSAPDVRYRVSADDGSVLDSVIEVTVTAAAVAAAGTTATSPAALADTGLSGSTTAVLGFTAILLGVVALVRAGRGRRS